MKLILPAGHMFVKQLKPLLQPSLVSIKIENIMGENPLIEQPKAAPTTPAQKVAKVAEILSKAAKKEGASLPQATKMGMDIATEGTAPAEKSD